ncbi:MAG: ATP-binding cassette domain-containing protein, partial [Acidobacteria bacterium]|nr:ATP-binding cassette domain-containing protein [Acidobacteriota bacterium]
MLPALESSRALLEVRDLSVTYGGTGDPRPVISNVNFDIAAGEVLGIQGPSGCGKTSIALALLKLLPSSAAASGSV